MIVIRRFVQWLSSGNIWKGLQFCACKLTWSHASYIWNYTISTTEHLLYASQLDLVLVSGDCLITAISTSPPLLMLRSVSGNCSNVNTPTVCKVTHNEQWRALRFWFFYICHIEKPNFIWKEAEDAETTGRWIRKVCEALFLCSQADASTWRWHTLILAHVVQYYKLFV